MTKQDFIDTYCEGSELLGDEKDEFLNAHVVMSCNCGEDGCQGWAMISNTPMNIKLYNMQNILNYEEI
jgi:hypothetical protein